MTTFYDSAWPKRMNTEGVLIYVGGDTPHPWSDAEIAAEPARYRLPCWVRSNPGSVNVQIDAAAFVLWLVNHGVPKGCATVLDLETAIDPTYVNAFGAALHAAGYKVLPYGSTSTLFQNPRLDGYFAADPSTVDHMYRGCVATQWLYAGAYDLDDVSGVVPLWDKLTHGPTPTVPAASPYIIQPGVTGVMVQTRLNVWGAKLTVDGIVGPASEAAIKTFQAAHALSVDGIVGPNTWNALLSKPPAPAPKPVPAPAPKPPAPVPAPKPPTPAPKPPVPAPKPPAPSPLLADLESLQALLTQFGAKLSDLRSKL